MSVTPEKLKEYLQKPNGPHKVILRNGEEALALWGGFRSDPIVVRRAAGTTRSHNADGHYYNGNEKDDWDIVEIPKETVRRWVFLREDGTFGEGHFDINKPFDTLISGKFVQVECTIVDPSDS